MVEKDCVIIFDQNEHGTYFTGQLITGRVVINFSKTRKLKGIKLQICGFSECQWRDHRGKAKVHHKMKKHGRHVFWGHEDYIASTTFLVGSEDSKNFSMDPGTYTYTFTCPIPHNSPSSFEGTYGHIRYLAKVVFMRSGSSNRTKNVGFTVLRLVDLNYDSAVLKAAANNEALEAFCCIQTKAVHLKVDLLQTGYVPGQYILVNVFVNNESAINCKRVEIRLNLRAIYTAEAPSMRITTEKMCLTKTMCGPVRHGEQRNFTERLRVPATPPTSESLSKVVRVSYEVCVVAVMNQLMCDPKAAIPITIGNVPLMYHAPAALPPVQRTLTAGETRADEPSTSVAATQAEIEEDTDFSSIEDEANNDNDAVEVKVEMPPPTYEEAMFMTTNIADNDGDANTAGDVTNFTPRYPVYDVENMVITPPPNLPVKRRRKKKAPVVTDSAEKPPRESPVQI